MLRSLIQNPLFETKTKVTLNLSQKATYRKRQSSEILHTPSFTEYDQLPGDPYQTVYYGYYDGVRHTDPRALDRFYRLNWGGWIRARGGRAHKIWSKKGQDLWWSKQHVLCSKKQSEMLEQMFTKKYRNKNFFVDDFYETYEERDFEFLPVGHAAKTYSYIKSKDYNR